MLRINLENILFFTYFKKLHIFLQYANTYILANYIYQVIFDNWLSSLILDLLEIEENLSFGYTAKNGENFSLFYDIRICIDNFDPNFCYLYR